MGGLTDWLGFAMMYGSTIKLSLLGVKWTRMSLRLSLVKKG